MHGHRDGGLQPSLDPYYGRRLSQPPTAKNSSQERRPPVALCSPGAMPSQTSHKSSWLKQSNKGHKGGRHTTKRASAAVNRGKVSSGSGGAGKSRPAGGKARSGMSGGQHAAVLAQSRRRQRTEQQRSAKKQAIALARRVGCGDSPPKVVLVVPLSADAEAHAQVCTALQSASEWSARGAGGAMTCAFPKDRQRICVLSPARSLFAVLDAAMAADVVVLVASARCGPDGIDDEAGRSLLAALRSQGMPAKVGVIDGLEGLPAKRAVEMRRLLTRYFSTELGSSVKVAETSESGRRALVRTILNTFPRIDAAFASDQSGGTGAGASAISTAAAAAADVSGASWRGNRAYLVADAAEVVGGDGTPSSSRVIQLRGYVRGRALSSNQLAHVVGVGTFRIRSIAEAEEPCPSRRGRAGAMEATPSGVLLPSSEAHREVLDGAAEPDLLAGEQTWPTEEELMRGDSRAAAEMSDDEAEDEGAESTAAVKTQAGGAPRPSSYQSAWLDPDDDDVETDGGAALDASADPEAEAKSKRQHVMMLERDEREFPDEVETPTDVPARERFARYRGLKSFRESFWDPKEQLPQDYSRLYAFRAFEMLAKRTIREHAAVDAQLKARRDSSCGQTDSRAQATQRGRDEGCVRLRL